MAAAESILDLIRFGTVCITCDLRGKMKRFQAEVDQLENICQANDPYDIWAFFYQQGMMLANDKAMNRLIHRSRLLNVFAFGGYVHERFNFLFNGFFI